MKNLILQERCLNEEDGHNLHNCRKCGSCNETDFKFCKNCGCFRYGITENFDYKQKHESNQEVSGVTLDRDLLNKINVRMQQLDNQLDASNYGKQKCRLKMELINFLKKVHYSKNIYNASPEDIRAFLIFKEDSGRTKLHNKGCIFQGKPGLQKCACPITLAVKSVDSMLGKIRAIFRDEGRAGEWNPMLFTGNPAAAPLLKRHLLSISLEHQKSKTARRQAVPLMFDKLGKLCRYLKYQIARERDEIKKFLFVRDLSYFSFICHSGNRGGDLGQITSDMIFELPQHKGFFCVPAGWKNSGS